MTALERDLPRVIEFLEAHRKHTTIMFDGLTAVIALLQQHERLLGGDNDHQS